MPERWFPPRTRPETYRGWSSSRAGRVSNRRDPERVDEYPCLCPLKGAAEILADYEGWPRLYDVERLQTNTVPCAAAIYYDDMYVERTFSEEAARSIQGIKLWVTNKYEHNALRTDGETVLGRLLEMVQG